MRTYLNKTLLTLLKRREAFEAITKIIERAEKLLAHDEEPIIFEAHIQQDDPNRYPIMAEGETVVEAYEKAIKLNHQWNRNNRRSVEIFAKIGDLRIALTPEDAAGIASHEAGEEISAVHFYLDDRVKKFPSPMVFRPQDEMPSGWYTLEPTLPKNPEIESSTSQSRRIQSFGSGVKTFG
jgi:hypothetical protein